MMKKLVDVKELISSLKKVIALHKVYLFYVITGIILTSLQPFIYIILPKYIIDELVGGKQFSVVIIYVIAMGVTLLLIHGLNSVIQLKQQQHSEILMYKISLYVGDISMQMDFSQLEQSKTTDTIEMAKESHNSMEAIHSVLQIITQFITIIGLIIIICSFNILLFLSTLIVLAVKLFSQYKVNQSWARCRADAKPFERKGEYMNNFAISHSGAKEIRLHNLADWLYEKMVVMVDKANSVFMKNFKLTSVYEVLAHFVFELQVLFYYVILIIAVLNNKITIGEFIMYITTVTTLSGSLDAIAYSITTLQRSSVYLKDIQTLHSMQSNTALQQNNIEKIDFSNYEIEFNNVSFKYPGTDEYVLKDVQLTIEENEKISIVGPNGAGKTTFIKLLCGFYQPTKGKILINGIDISRAPYGELIEHISAIFQDFKIFSFKLQDNVVMDAKVDEEKIFKTLEKVQLKERLEELPKGLGTYLYKDFDEEGIELSGGQMQKLAIARALYKDPSIIILDEPTANLDALSEYEIYQNLKDISHGKTSIFISHRLASTRFTDKIIVFNEGRIHEYGSHEELITKNGLYAEMFSKQARYYSQ